MHSGNPRHSPGESHRKRLSIDLGFQVTGFGQFLKQLGLAFDSPDLASYPPPALYGRRRHCRPGCVVVLFAVADYAVTAGAGRRQLERHPDRKP